MYHVLGFVQIRQMGVLYAIFQRGVYVFHACCLCCYINDTSMVLTALGQTEEKVSSDIVRTMNLGAGVDRYGVLPTTRQIEPRMHPFWARFECHAETMRYIRIKGYAGNPMTQIANRHTNHY